MVFTRIESSALVIVGIILTLGCNLISTEPTVTPTEIVPPVAPAIDILDAIGNGDLVAVTQHIEYGSNLNGPFVLEDKLGGGGSPLHLAAITRQKEITIALIGGGAYIDIRGKDVVGGTPLHWTAFYGMLDMVVLLVGSGADVNSKDNFGSTPLDAAKAENAVSDKVEKQAVVDYLSTYLPSNQ